MTLESTKSGCQRLLADAESVTPQADVPGPLLGEPSSLHARQSLRELHQHRQSVSLTARERKGKQRSAAVGHSLWHTLAGLPWKQEARRLVAEQFPDVAQLQAPLLHP